MIRRSHLIAAAACLSATGFMNAGPMRHDIEVQTYRDFAENQGQFTPGATNITIYHKDGTSAGVIPLIPDFAAINDGGYVTMFTPTFGMSVDHVGYTTSPTFGSRYNHTGRADSVFMDTYKEGSCQL